MDSGVYNPFMDYVTTELPDESNIQPVTLYHWTLNRTKLKAKGFPPNKDRHSDSELGVWLTDIITGSPESIKSEMRMVTIEIP